MRIILIGTNHAHQLVNHEAGDSERFNIYLKVICQAENIDLLAEELNEEAISAWHTADSTARALALDIEIPHIFCDPNSKERAALGILDYKQLWVKQGYGKGVTPEQHEYLENEEKKFWAAREEYWLNKILSTNAKNCLLIIGARHVEQVINLIPSKGHICELKSANWHP